MDGKLELVEMAGDGDLMPFELSGGMRKGVSLARALVMDPELILFDEALGRKHYLTLYFPALLCSGCVQLVVVSLAAGAGVYPTVGASGAMFGVLLAFGMLFPRRTLVLLFPPIQMLAILFVILYGIIELLNGIIGDTNWRGAFRSLGRDARQLHRLEALAGPSRSPQL